MDTAETAFYYKYVLIKSLISSFKSKGHIAENMTLKNSSAIFSVHYRNIVFLSPILLPQAVAVTEN